MEETTKQAPVGAEREPLLEQAQRLVERQRADQMEHIGYNELLTLKALFGERIATVVLAMRMAGKDADNVAMSVAFAMALIGVEIGYALAKDDMVNTVLRERRPM